MIYFKFRWIGCHLGSVSDVDGFKQKSSPKKKQDPEFGASEFFAREHTPDICRSYPLCIRSPSTQRCWDGVSPPQKKRAPPPASMKISSATSHRHPKTTEEEPKALSPFPQNSNKRFLSKKWMHLENIGKYHKLLGNCGWFQGFPVDGKFFGSLQIRSSASRRSLPGGVFFRELEKGGDPGGSQMIFPFGNKICEINFQFVYLAICAHFFCKDKICVNHCQSLGMTF